MGYVLGPNSLLGFFGIVPTIDLLSGNVQAASDETIPLVFETSVANVTGDKRAVRFAYADGTMARLRDMLQAGAHKPSSFSTPQAQRTLEGMDGAARIAFMCETLKYKSAEEGYQHIGTLFDLRDLETIYALVLNVDWEVRGHMRRYLQVGLSRFPEDAAPNIRRIIADMLVILEPAHAELVRIVLQEDDFVPFFNLLNTLKEGKPNGWRQNQLHELLDSGEEAVRLKTAEKIRAFIAELDTSNEEELETKVFLGQILISHGFDI